MYGYKKSHYWAHERLTLMALKKMFCFLHPHGQKCPLPKTSIKRYILILFFPFNKLNVLNNISPDHKYNIFITFLYFILPIC